MSGLNISCAALHTQSTSEERNKEFYCRDSAFAFYERAKEESSQWAFTLGTHLQNPKIDSLFIERKD